VLELGLGGKGENDGIFRRVVREEERKRRCKRAYQEKKEREIRTVNTYMC